MDLISVVAYVTGTCRDLQAIQPIYRILYLDRGVVNKLVRRRIGPATRPARASDSTLAGKCRPKRTGDYRHSAVTKSAGVVAANFLKFRVCDKVTFIFGDTRLFITLCRMGTKTF